MINNVVSERLERLKNAEKVAPKDNAVLLMLSGGRDSLLSACRLIEQGLFVYLIAYDHGCFSDLAAVKTVAERIVSVYGKDCVLFAGIRSIAANLYRFQESYLYQSIKDSSRRYPDLRPAQLPCLACHTAMYVESIAYCKAHGISKLAEGARESQKFLVELPPMIERYRKLTEENKIELLLPVYDLVSDWERKLALTDHGFIPKTLEPQCWLSCPLGDELRLVEIQSLLKYYDNEIAPQLQSLIAARTKSAGLPKGIDTEGLR